MAAPARTARPKAAAPGERLELDLYGEINAWSVRDLIATLRANPNADVTLRINSPGGDVIEGFALANVLQGHAGKKVAIVEGACCSAATFIACACEVRMYPESFLMVHGPSADTWGGVEDMESAAALLSKMRDLMTNMYTRKTGADEATVRAWLERNAASDRGAWEQARRVEAFVQRRYVYDPEFRERTRPAPRGRPVYVQPANGEHAKHQKLEQQRPKHLRRPWRRHRRNVQMNHRPGGDVRRAQPPRRHEARAVVAPQRVADADEQHASQARLRPGAHTPSQTSSVRKWVAQLMHGS